jgi:hypothetical protein
VPFGDKVARFDGASKGGTPRASKGARLLITSIGFVGGQTEQLADNSVIGYRALCACHLATDRLDVERPSASVAGLGSYDPAAEGLSPATRHSPQSLEIQPVRCDDLRLEKTRHVAERMIVVRSTLRGDAISGHDHIKAAHVGVVRRKEHANVGGKTGHDDGASLQALEQDLEDPCGRVRSDRASVCNSQTPAPAVGAGLSGGRERSLPGTCRRAHESQGCQQSKLSFTYTTGIPASRARRLSRAMFRAALLAAGRSAPAPRKSMG